MGEIDVEEKISMPTANQNPMNYPSEVRND
jgi:hypothetical protein